METLLFWYIAFLFVVLYVFLVRVWENVHQYSVWNDYLDEKISYGLTKDKARKVANACNKASYDDETFVVKNKKGVII